MADLSSTRVFGKLTVLHEAILKANAEIVGTLTVDTVNATNYLGLPTEATRWPDWNEVTGKPTTFAPSAHTHPWGDLTGVPATASRWPTWAEVTSKPSFATVATSGSYVDLSNTPNLSTVATTGSYTDLVNRPSNATPTTSGFMSSGDKSKLDGVEAGAEVNAVDSVNGQTGVVSLDTNDVSEGTNLYFTTARARSAISVGGDLSYTNGVISFNETYSTAGEIKTAYESNTNTNAFTDSEKTKLSNLENVNLSGSGATSVSGTYPNITISSTDTNTTYSAGTGISLSGTTFSLTDESYTSAEKTKLAGIETGAEANSVDSVNGQTGIVSLSASNVGAYPDTNPSSFVDAAGAVSAVKGDVDWNATNWDTAFGWGDHASEGYITDAPSDGTQYARLNGAWSAVSGGTDYTRITTNYTASSGEYLYVDTSAGPINITLPATPADFDVVVLADDTGNFAFNNVTLLRNGSSLQNDTNDLIIDNSNREVTVVYYNGTWNVFARLMPRWPTPNQVKLDGPETGNEGDELRLFIVGWEPANTYNINVSGGSYTVTSDAVYWTLPSIGQDEHHFIQVEESGVGGTTSYVHEVSVFNIPTLADDSISVTDFSVNDSNTGWSI